MQQRGTLYLTGIAIGLAAGLLAAWLCHPATSAGLLGDYLYGAELISYDYRLAWAPSPGRSDEVTLVTIDEESFSHPELSVWPWRRRHHASVLRNLHDAGAAVIGVDVIFGGTSSDAEPPPDIDPFFWEPPLSEDDEELVGALGGGDTLLAAQISSQAVGGDEASGELIATEFPHPDFEDAALALGAVSVINDFDGTVRRYLTSLTHQDETFPSMAVGLVAQFRGRDASDVAGEVEAAARSAHPSLPADGDYLISFRAPIGQGFSRVPFWRVLEGDFDPETVAGRIVLIGATARSLQDLHETPVSVRGVPGTSMRRAQMSGVEIIAHAVDTILSSRYIRPAPTWLTVLLAAALSGLTGALIIRLRPLKALAFAWLPLVVLAALLTFQLLWTHSVWLPLVPLLLGVSLAYVANTGFLELTIERQERRLRQAWSQRVSPEVMDVILSNPDLTHVEGTRVVGTVFFSDLRGFTTFCSTCEPEEVVAQINGYLTVCTRVIRDHGGTVHKFIGDGVMAVFGDPVPHEDHADRALRASLEIQRRMSEMREKTNDAGWPMFVRIGLHSGELVAGDIGSERMLEYTVMGETVSVAARLEGLNKELGTEILLSSATAEMLTSRFELEPLGEVDVRGRPEPLEVLTVRGGVHDASSQADHRVGSSGGRSTDVGVRHTGR
ncbi:MAG: adenylate/guanylate cyclase domain-containing protein [Armatimonadota bacterium]